MLPFIIPLFPLPSVVLFPNVYLPLHVFEPRYREMVADALRGDRVIGMVLLRPGWEADYEGRPAIYPIGCAGVVTHAEQLADGGYNIILRGLDKFRVTREEADCSYRRASVEPIPEHLSELERQAVHSERERLKALLARSLDRRAAEPRIPDGIADQDLVNALAQYLELEPVEKQALLERDGLLARCRSLIELLEMKVILAKSPGGSMWAH